MRRGEQVNKVAGNFHFSPGKSFSQDLLVLRKTDYNVSHAIHHLSFGTKVFGLASLPTSL
eukprot:768818-Hanusia_phi.AAC.10